MASGERLRGGSEAERAFVAYHRPIVRATTRFSSPTSKKKRVPPTKDGETAQAALATRRTPIHVNRVHNKRSAWKEG